MKRQKYRACLSATILILFSLGFQVLFLTGGTPWVIFASSFATSTTHSIVALPGKTPVPAITVVTSKPVATGGTGGVAVTPPATGSLKRSYIQTGMIFPQWGTSAYSLSDANWTLGLKEIQAQTAAQWIGLTINLYQSSLSSTNVEATQLAPTPGAMASGIRIAHAMHYHVFVIPLLTVGGSRSWAGGIHFATEQQTQAWFDSYWQTLEPYAQAAAQAGVEEFSLGTEYELLQLAPPSMWNQLIERVHAIYPGKLAYGMNWTSLSHPLPSWIYNPSLYAIGISGYFPVINVAERVDPRVMPALWREKVESRYDALAIQLGKPVFISEIGYRDSADALYNPWQIQTSAPADPAEQAGAYNAALSNLMLDPHIMGIFVWAWSMPAFEPNGRPAAQVLHQWYTSLTQ